MTHSDKKMPPLHKCVAEAIECYLKNLDGHKSTNIYQLFIEETEIPLFKAVMEHVKHNQSEAAIMLGISRGTLRKKLKQYKI